MLGLRNAALKVVSPPCFVLLPVYRSSWQDEVTPVYCGNADAGQTHFEDSAIKADDSFMLHV